MSTRRAFTLVELLVVIGIIALLVAILLPSLARAREQAQAVKCAAHLREIGNAFQMYAMDNNGYYPVARSWLPYTIDDFTYTGTPAYWPSFLAKYVTQTKQGVASGTDGVLAVDARNTVLWGCPTWLGYDTGTTGGLNRIQTGLGMNPWPTFTADYPTVNFPPGTEMAAFFAGPTSPGTFHRQVQWNNPAQRALVADSRFWMVESNPPPADGSFPPQSTHQNSQTYTHPNQTMVDVYRHGRPPGPGPGPNTFAATGGRVGYNILYADGHVETRSDQREAYFSMRQRYPG